jgi:7-cyano-7-deazaguanine reductase
MKKKTQKSQFQPLDRRYDVQGIETIDASVLDTFPYEYPNRDQRIHIETDEFTAVCPFSGLPDFATIKVDYVPDKKIIELRSCKYYLLSYRNVGIYQEHVVNKILEDLVVCCKPKQMQVTADYKVRGGVHTVCSVEYTQKRRA